MPNRTLPEKVYLRGNSTEHALKKLTDGIERIVQECSKTDWDEVYHKAFRIESLTGLFPWISVVFGALMGLVLIVAGILSEGQPCQDRLCKSRSDLKVVCFLSLQDSRPSGCASRDFSCCWQLC